MNSSHQTVVKTAPPSSASGVADAAANAGSKLRHAAIAAVLLIVVAALAGLIPRWQHRAALRFETRDLAVQTVAVVSAGPGQATGDLVLPAEVKPLVDSPIYARSSGYLKRWLVDIGAEVKEGDLLAETDAPELRQELAQAKAELVQAEAALGLARTTAARWAELLKTASVSEQEAAEKEADLELKLANVEAARAHVRRLEELQSFSSIKAPFAGTITARAVDVGVEHALPPVQRHLVRCRQHRALHRPGGCDQLARTPGCAKSIEPLDHLCRARGPGERVAMQHRHDERIELRRAFREGGRRGRHLVQQRR